MVLVEAPRGVTSPQYAEKLLWLVACPAALARSSVLSLESAAGKTAALDWRATWTRAVMAKIRFIVRLLVFLSTLKGLVLLFEGWNRVLYVWNEWSVQSRGQSVLSRAMGRKPYVRESVGVRLVDYF